MILDEWEIGVSGTNEEIKGTEEEGKEVNHGQTNGSGE